MIYFESFLCLVDQPNDFVPLEPDSRLFPAGNGSLLIRSADPSHEGHYSCEASNGIGAVLKKVVFLRVNGMYIVWLFI